MNVAITGASGFIIKELLKRNLFVKNNLRYLTRRINFDIQGAKCFQADLNNRDIDITPFFSGVDLVIHGASEVYQESLMYKTNVEGTQLLLKSLGKSRQNTKDQIHWVQLSSCGAYGVTSYQREKVVIKENSPCNPQNEYERTKTRADDLVIEFAKNNPWFKYTIIRPTIVFGVGMRSTALLNIVKYIKKGIFFYVDTKESIANYVHVNDVVKAVEASLLNDLAYNEIFIVSNDCKFSEVFSSIAAELRVLPPYFVLKRNLVYSFINILGAFGKSPIKFEQVDVLARRVEFSSQKIKDLLGWRPSAPVPVQIRNYVKESLVMSQIASNVNQMS